MNSRAIVIGVAAAAIVLVAGILGYRWLLARDEIALRPDDQSYVARGEKVYLMACASCHCADLQGQADWSERGPEGFLPAPPHEPSGHT